MPSDESENRRDEPPAETRLDRIAAVVFAVLAASMIAVPIAMTAWVISHPNPGPPPPKPDPLAAEDARLLNEAVADIGVKPPDVENAEFNAGWNKMAYDVTAPDTSPKCHRWMFGNSCD